uniref:Uncharacterized protein n=1 Tax=Oryza rufipogon TaxID=4529 RepID=A0A0E0RH34_ORYRU
MPRWPGSSATAGSHRCRAPPCRTSSSGSPSVASMSTSLPPAPSTSMSASSLGWRTVKGVAAAVPVCSTSAPPRRWGRRSTSPPCSMSCCSRRRLRCHWSRPSSSIRRLTKYQDLAGLCWGCSCWWEASGAATHQIPSQRESKFLGDK